MAWSQVEIRPPGDGLFPYPLPLGWVTGSPLHFRAEPEGCTAEAACGRVAQRCPPRPAGPSAVGPSACVAPAVGWHGPRMTPGTQEVLKALGADSLEQEAVRVRPLGGVS